MSDLKVEVWDIDKLIPYENNAKLHSEEQVAALARSIAKFGYDQPIVVDKDGVIIKGHGRWLASRKLDREKVQVVCRRDLSDDEVKAARLADNQVASKEYDTEKLQSELTALAALDFDMSTMGFEPRELDFLTADLGEMDESVFAEDMGEEVANQKTNNAELATAADEAGIPLAKALGVKTVTPKQTRDLKTIVSYCEERLGNDKTGLEALIEYFQEWMLD